MLFRKTLSALTRLMHLFSLRLALPVHSARRPRYQSRARPSLRLESPPVTINKDRLIVQNDDASCSADDILSTESVKTNSKPEALPSRYLANGQTQTYTHPSASLHVIVKTSLAERKP